MLMYIKYEITGEAEKIYNQFIGPDAPELINLPDYIQKELTIGFKNKYHVNNR